MTKHTPGPWTHVGFAVVQPLSAKANGSKIAAQCFGPDGEANARLIAAAPDMLAALQNLKWALENVETEYAEQVAQARAAIAKAQGEG